MIIEQIDDVVLGAGEEVIDADDVITFVQQTAAQVRAEEAGSTGDEDAFSVMHELKP